MLVRFCTLYIFQLHKNQCPFSNVKRIRNLKISPQFHVSRGHFPKNAHVLGTFDYRCNPFTQQHPKNRWFTKGQKPPAAMLLATWNKINNFEFNFIIELNLCIISCWKSNKKSIFSEVRNWKKVTLLVAARVKTNP